MYTDYIRMFRTELLFLFKETQIILNSLVQSFEDTDTFKLRCKTAYRLFYVREAP